MALAFIIFLGAVLCGLGWPAIKHLDRGMYFRSSERLMIGFSFGAMILGVAIEVVGRYRLDGTSMSALLALATLLAIPGWKSMPWRYWRGSVASEIHADTWTRILWLMVIAVAASSLIQGMAPPNDYDSLMYHLAIPQLDVERGHIAPAWNNGLAHAFFPQMLGNLYRLVLALAGEKPVQMVHGLFCLVAAGSAAALSLRMGFGRNTALLAALMFLAIRAVVWQMASAEVDIASGALLGLSLLTFLGWRHSGSAGNAVLFGLMLAGGLWVKYHGGAVGVAFAIPVLVALFRRQVSFGQVLLVAVVTVLAFSPHLIRNGLYTGNPLFPLFNPLFNPGEPNFFQGYQDVLGLGRKFWHLLVTPVALFELPTHYFDGMVMGTPYLLAFIPAVYLARKQIRDWIPPAIVVLVFYVEWFYLLSQQVRFLAAIWPVLAAFAAIGAVAFWQASAGQTVARTTFLAFAVVLALGQAGFVGIYSALRLPSALGFMSAEVYHTKTPTLTGAFYTTCSFIRQHLEPGQRYLSLITPHSYYCPQLNMVQKYRNDEESQSWKTGATLPPLSLKQALEEFQRQDYRFVIVMKSEEWRAGKYSATLLQDVDFKSEYRFGPAVALGIDGLTPLISDNKASVFDGREVRENLRRQLENERP